MSNDPLNTERQYEVTIDGEMIGRFDSWELAARCVELKGLGKWVGSNVFTIEGNVQIKAVQQ